VRKTPTLAKLGERPIKVKSGKLKVKRLWLIDKRTKIRDKASCEKLKLFYKKQHIKKNRDFKFAKPYKTVKLQTGRVELKLTNYKPKLNERAVGVGVEPTRSSYFTLRLFPKSSPPRQGGVSANFTTLQCIFVFNFKHPACPFVLLYRTNVKHTAIHCKYFNKLF
jgi:hypothetical protein